MNLQWPRIIAKETLINILSEKYHTPYKDFYEIPDV